LKPYKAAGRVPEESRTAIIVPRVMTRGAFGYDNTALRCSGRSGEGPYDLNPLR